MSRSVRVTCLTIGLLLIASAIAVSALPVANFWPWALLFGSVGAGLSMGTWVAFDDAADERRRSEQGSAAATPTP